MSVDFTAIIDNFLNAELGEDVRGSLVEIAEAVQGAINSQLLTVTTDLSDQSDNASLQAKFLVNLIFAGRNTDRTIPDVPARYIIPDNVFSIYEMPANTWIHCLGSELINYLGDDFSYLDLIENGTSYVVTKQYTYGNGSISMYNIYNIAGTQHFIGYSPYNNVTTILWRYIDVDAPLENVRNLQDAAFEAYTEFDDTERGWYDLNGAVGSQTTIWHSQLLEIRPNTVYYISHRQDTKCIGAIFNKNGVFIAGLKGGTATEDDSGISLTEITPSYAETLPENTYSPAQAAHDEPDVSIYPVSGFMSIYKFTTPANARYISLNVGNSFNYKLCMSSKPVYMLGGTGNFVILKNDQLYQSKKDKKLCVIGPSTLMIDRLWRANGNGDQVPPHTTDVGGYIAGLQEYLAPYYADVISFGYSGAAYPNNAGSSTGRCSIYTRICGGTESFTYNDVPRSYTLDPKDLSGYDDFVIFTSGNGVGASTVVGDYTDEDPGTYSGAVYLICKKILTDNPRAKIYIRNFAVETAPSAKEKRVECNVQLKAIADKLQCSYIDMTTGGVVNEFNRLYFTYDGTHSNNVGNQIAGLRLRKEILGF